MRIYPEVIPQFFLVLQVMRNFVVADNQEITRLGILSILNTMKDINEVSIVSNKSELINYLSDNENSVVLLDYTMFDFSSVSELHIVQERYNKVSWILFSDELSDTFLRYLLANKMDFSIVHKISSLEEIKSSVHTAIYYDTYICRDVENHLSMLKKIMDEGMDYNLTASEKEILKDIASGKSTKEIAVGRNVSFHTIVTHRKNIFRKLGVNNVHEATRYAIKAGIVDISDYYI